METENSLPRHILFIRNSAMGDVAMLPHAVRALKSAYPDVKVSVATRELFKPFFRGLDVDFIFLDTKGAHRNLSGIFNFVREIHKRGVDAIADTHGVIRSYQIDLIAKLFGIRSACIDKGKVEKWFRLGYSKADAQPLKHSVVRYCDVVRRFGFKFDDPTPITKKPTYANPMGEKRGVWVGFAPFSAHTGKTYPTDMREEAVRLLSERCERLFIHSGGGEELRFAEEMERKYENVTAVFPLLRLEKEIDLIANLDCMVSMDSMAMHLAALVATPVVSIWGATHPEFGFLGYGCSNDCALQVELPCRPCSIYGKKECKYGDYRCLRAITPQMVADKVSEVIAPLSE